jgi:alpha-methylacyl-CoA racemase
MNPTRPVAASNGPLTGVRVLEFSGLGPGPFAGMLLAELGADVVKIDRPGDGGRNFSLDRSKRSIALDLKAPGDVARARGLAMKADILIEGFRPGVMERLGLGPETLLAQHPRLVYGRMTGWGREGPLAQAAGHDLNYAGLSGALWAMGRKDEPPSPPLNLVADFGGGSLYLVMGVLAALVHARETGEGQVVDAAMVDGVASLTGMFYGLRARGLWTDAREDNFLDGGAPWYRCYACADGGFVALAALEPQFWDAFLQRAGLDDPIFLRREDRATWSPMRAKLETFFSARDRDDWVAHFEDVDACVSPVLSLAEAPLHPHNRARGVFQAHDAGVEPVAAPRFSATPGAIKGPPPAPDQDRAEILADWGIETA